MDMDGGWSVSAEPVVEASATVVYAEAPQAPQYQQASWTVAAAPATAVDQGWTVAAAEPVVAEGVAAPVAVYEVVAAQVEVVASPAVAAPVAGGSWANIVGQQTAEEAQQVQQQAALQPIAQQAEQHEQRQQEAAAWKLFEEALFAIISCWSALRLAIEGNWGGGDSMAKANNFFGELLQIFKQRQRVDPNELSEWLQEYMEDQFSTECEDGSTDEAAAEMCRLYIDVGSGNFASAQAIMRRAAEATTKPAGAAAADQEDDEMDADAEDMEAAGGAASMTQGGCSGHVGGTQ
jgi:pre-rRNA-processing protein TSR2